MLSLNKTLAVVGAALLLGLGIGFFVVRAHPARHYVRFGAYLLDESSGKLCTPVGRKHSNDRRDIFDQLAANQRRDDPPFCGED